MATSPKEISSHITLISSDGYEFIISRDAACVAGTIKRMLDPRTSLGSTTTGGGFSEADTGICTLRTINGVVLEKVCEYLYYNVKTRGLKDVPDMELPRELCLELLMAADFLQV